MRFWDLINLVSLSYFILFAVYLLVKSGRKPYSNYYLAAFLLIQSSCVLNTILWRYYSYTHIHLTGFFHIEDAVLFLWGPFLYFYFRSYTEINFKSRWQHALHALPALLVATYFFSRFYRFSTPVKIQLLEKGVLSPNANLILLISFRVITLIYLLAAAARILSYRRQLKNSVSDLEKTRSKWITLLTGGFFIVFLLDILIILPQFFNIGLFSGLGNIGYLILLFLAILILVKGLDKPEIFLGLQDIRQNKYTGSNLKEADRLFIRKQLHQLMAEKKRYKVPSINIKDLADEIGALPKYVSQVINEDYKQNFYDFINSLRIKEARELLENRTGYKMNILEILYETGFNSKSAFNTAFKKYTGQTPTNYRQKYF